MKKNTKTRLKSIWSFVEETFAIVAAAVIIIFSYFNVIEDKIVYLGLLGILGFVALQLIKTKKDIESMNDTAKNVFEGMHASQLNQNYDEIFFAGETEEQPTKEEKEMEIVEEAQQKLLIIQETGNRFIEKNSKAISERLSRGVKVEIVICAVSNVTQTLLMLRNANLNSPRNFQDRYQVFIARLMTTLRDEIGDIDEKKVKNLSLRYSPYPIDITSVMSDPDNPVTGHCVVRFAGFRVTYEKKLDIEIFKKHSKNVFAYYHDQIMQYQLLSYKKILLTGAPRCGKTTLFIELLEAVNYKGNPDIFWVISREKTCDKKRVGFEVSYSANPEPVAFATLQPGAGDDAQAGINKYDLTNTEPVWNAVAEAISAAPQRIFVIDEIGLMQARSAAFIQAINSLMKNPEITVFATISEEAYRVAALKEIAGDVSAVDYTLTAQNREEMQQMLVKELKGSLQLAKYEKNLEE